MSIKFVCPCGKRLKARDDMAARRIMCPRCGNPVGVPSLDPSKPTPMTPAERLRAQARRPTAMSFLDDSPAPMPVPKDAPEETGSKQAEVRKRPGAASPEKRLTPVSDRSDPLPSASSGLPGVPTVPSEPKAQLAMVPSDAAALAGVRQQRRGRPHKQYRAGREWQMERYWFECLGYPFRAMPLVFGLALALSLLTVIFVLLIPEALAETPGDARLGPVLLAFLLPMIAFAYVCGFLDCVLSSAADGESRHIRWPGRNLALILRSFIAWVLAALLVPAPLAVIGFYYWLYCGDLQVVDWIILIELGLFGAGYWLLAVLAVSRGERLRDLNPARVVELAEKLGWRSLALAAMAGLLFLGHGFLAYSATGMLHGSEGTGLLLVLFCWVSFMYWATFVFRVLGMWCYQRNIV
jgi:hypothetical protein